MNAKGRKAVVAIDGPSGVGKSTVSKMIAERFGFEYVDTGAMYRAVAVAASDVGLDFTSDTAMAGFCKMLEISFADNGRKILVGDVDFSERIRTPEAGELASRSSALPSVRKFLVGLQREMGGHESTSISSKSSTSELLTAGVPTAGLGVVMEGRDIGTNVFTDADLKIFLDADEKVRAGRRHGDYSEKADASSVENVAIELAERDRRDKERRLSPLAVAKDAVLVDTTELTIDEVVERIAGLMKERGLAG